MCLRMIHEPQNICGVMQSLHRYFAKSLGPSASTMQSGQTWLTPALPSCQNNSSRYSCWWGTQSFIGSSCTYNEHRRVICKEQQERTESRILRVRVCDRFGALPMRSGSRSDKSWKTVSEGVSDGDLDAEKRMSSRWIWRMRRRSAENCSTVIVAAPDVSSSRSERENSIACSTAFLFMKGVFKRVTKREVGGNNFRRGWR